MTNLKNDTILEFTEIKNGNASAKTFENSVEGYISAVYEKEVDGRLDVGVEPIKDEDGEIVDYTPNKFFSLPLEEQLDLCMQANGERYASQTSYKIAE